MSAAEQNVTDAVEDGVAEIVEQIDAHGNKITAEHARTREVQNLANEIHNKVVEPCFNITLPAQPVEECFASDNDDADPSSCATAPACGFSAFNSSPTSRPRCCLQFR